MATAFTRTKKNPPHGLRRAAGSHWHKAETVECNVTSINFQMATQAR
jgi:hypothetical protein